MCERATNRQDTGQEANILRNQWNNDGGKKIENSTVLEQGVASRTESVLLKEHFTQTLNYVDGASSDAFYST